MRIRDPFDSFRGIRSPFGNRRASAPPAPALDPDAADYISRVEDADSTTLGTPVTLEPAVVTAIDTFFKGLKADGVFAALKSSCILAGARTVNGIIEPLKSDMETVTNNGFGQVNYDRKTGLIGDGATKYLDTNVPSNVVGPQDTHIAAYVKSTGSGGIIIAAGVLDNGPVLMQSSENGNGGRMRSNTYHNQEAVVGALPGFFSGVRDNSATCRYRADGVTQTFNDAAAGVSTTENFLVFARAKSDFSQHRIAFYSVGNALPEPLFDARVSQLMTDLDGAIA